MFDKPIRHCSLLTDRGPKVNGAAYCERWKKLFSLLTANLLRCNLQSGRKYLFCLESNCLINNTPVIEPFLPNSCLVVVGLMSTNSFLV
ncbi:hypothetical protein L596_003835 [Steinernema carpocapsae]|uniref:Uncharacterized protein n=1 Tax=Steinernema carpocapsae TaxID=34508 RepID=A0A4V6I7Y1_STECR|nr:hypothetical protein L596_003835 [Steinernema carpocapsae]